MPEAPSGSLAVVLAAQDRLRLMRLVLLVAAAARFLPFPKSA